jgi:carbon storage regulator
MLVLSRLKSQVIRINDDITIRVLDVRGNRVQIGIDAPISVKVLRDEIYEAKSKEATDDQSAA